MDEEKIIAKQRNDMERIIALALVKSLYNQGKISEFVFRNIRRGCREILNFNPYRTK